MQHRLAIPTIQSIILPTCAKCPSPSICSLALGLKDSRYWVRLQVPKFDPTKIALCKPMGMRCKSTKRGKIDKVFHSKMALGGGHMSHSKVELRVYLPSQGESMADIAGG